MHFYLSKRYVPKNCVYGFFTNFSSRKLFKNLYFKYRWAFLTWKSKIWRDWSLPHFEIRRDRSPPKFWKIFRKFGEIRAFHSERLKYPVFITTAFWNLSLSLLPKYCCSYYVPRTVWLVIASLMHQRKHTTYSYHPRYTLLQIT